MAGEWINRDTGLRSHPAVLHLWLHFEKKYHKGLLADCVCEMWAYADQFGHVDGDDILCDLTPELLDAHVDVPGFAAALTKFREKRADKKPWLVVEGDRVRFPGLYAVMDSSSKRRAESREKKKRERAARRKKGDPDESVPKMSRDKLGHVPDMSRDTRRTAPPQQQQTTEHRQQQHQHQCAAEGGGGGGEDAEARRKALEAAGINPGPVLDELAATNLRPSQIALIAQRIRNTGGKGGVIVNALRKAASEPPQPLTAKTPTPTSPDPPVDPEAEKQALRAMLETTTGTRARRIIENRLAELGGAA
jgi:hypothetical protein